MKRMKIIPATGQRWLCTDRKKTKMDAVVEIEKLNKKLTYIYDPDIYDGEIFTSKVKILAGELITGARQKIRSVGEKVNNCPISYDLKYSPQKFDKDYWFYLPGQEAPEEV